MAFKVPVCWVCAPEGVEHKLMEQLELLGLAGRAVSQQEPPKDSEDNPVCLITVSRPRPRWLGSGTTPAHSLDGQPGDLPWVLLDGGDAATSDATVVPHAQLPWPAPLPSLNGVMGGLVSRWRSHMLARAKRGLVGHSAPVEALRREIEQVAPTNATVLILGESGTGKEVVARMVHMLSDRATKPFIPVNCGAIPSELLESELFGHEKGAFTGAISARPGRFELAQGGTLFLDEIGDMPMPMQVKILRVLQERTFERVGGKQTIEADVRVIAATHRDLETRIEEGSFRQDLFYRLNVFPIETIPLRELREDIPLIVEALVERLRAEGRGGLHFTSAALDTLARLPWPGNVRELSNVIERLSILHGGQTVDRAQLPAKLLALLSDDPVENEPTGLAGDTPAESALPPAADAPVAQEDVDPRQAFASMATVEKYIPHDPESLADWSFYLPEEGFDLKQQLEAIEIGWIRAALDGCDGVVAQAARQLGIRRTTLVEKMRKYQLAG